ncbi:hypothetical protein SSP35_04_04090 [Streptomyces sp. NBRC 110611]|nr:hypothetical protein SSP35_04_04090 [Streptomyces sp. NBRC 110611]
MAALEALHRYDSDGGAKFSTYAYTRIKGAIWDGSTSRSGPAVSADAVMTFKKCIGIVGGDMEAAEYLVTLPPSPPERRHRTHGPSGPGGHGVPGCPVLHQARVRLPC